LALPDKRKKRKRIRGEGEKTNREIRLVPLGVLRVVSSLQKLFYHHKRRNSIATASLRHETSENLSMESELVLSFQ
jgi:hypothetical protein